MPCRRHNSAIPAPASCSCRMPTICSVENRLVRIGSSLGRRPDEDSHYHWTSFRGSHHRSYYYLVLHRITVALNDANQAVGLTPDDPDALSTRAHVFEALGKYREALVDYNRVFEIDPDDSHRDFRGFALLELGETEAAFADLRISLD